MADLHDDLTALAVAWPETPDLVDGRARAAGAGARARRRAGATRAVRVAPRARLRPRGAARRVRDHDGRVARTRARPCSSGSACKSVRVERREPVAPPPHPGRLGAGLGLGTPVTLEQARERAPVPRGARRPGARRPRRGLRRGGQRRARLRLAPGPPARGEHRRGPARPGVPRPRRPVHREDASAWARRLERLRVEGDPAYFIAGAHGFAYESASGGGSFEPQRLAGNTLLVEREDGQLIRIEGALGATGRSRSRESIP